MYDYTINYIVSKYNHGCSHFLNIVIYLDYNGMKENLITIGLVLSIFTTLIGIVKCICYLFGANV